MNYNGAEWETGNTTDDNVIFLLLKDRNSSRFSHFHISKNDTLELINNLLEVINNTDIRIEHLNKK